jgi:hypothetical protein
LALLGSYHAEGISYYAPVNSAADYDKFRKRVGLGINKKVSELKDKCRWTEYRPYDSLIDENLGKYLE